MNSDMRKYSRLSHIANKYKLMRNHKLLAMINKVCSAMVAIIVCMICILYLNSNPFEKAIYMSMGDNALRLGSKTSAWFEMFGNPDSECSDFKAGYYCWSEIGLIVNAHPHYRGQAHHIENPNNWQVSSILIPQQLIIDEYNQNIEFKKNLLVVINHRNVKHIKPYELKRVFNFFFISVGDDTVLVDNIFKGTVLEAKYSDESLVYLKIFAADRFLFFDNYD
jgi:hypothetical protein